MAEQIASLPSGQEVVGSMTGELMFFTNLVGLLQQVGGSSAVWAGSFACINQGKKRVQFLSKQMIFTMSLLAVN